jgi:tagatose-1,6-bisphosphate aldolase
MLEPLSYSLNENRKLSSEEKRYVVTESAKRLTPLNVDILKAEFPLDPSETDESKWMMACREISAASHIPWILLSAAVDYDTYVRQVAVACNAGASGIAVGRAVWQEAVTMTGLERTSFLRSVARSASHGSRPHVTRWVKPLHGIYSAEAQFDWYKTLLSF